MKQGTRTRLAIGAAIIAICVLNYLERRSYRCQMCFATRVESQWRIGGWSNLSLPLTPSWGRTQLSRFAQDFSLGDHQHSWRFAQESPYYAFGLVWGGCGIGAGRHTSDIFRFYERDNRFRKYVQDAIAGGRISKAKFIELTACLDRDDTPLKKEASDFLDAYFDSQ